MTRLKSIQGLVSEVVQGIADPVERNSAYAHLYGVSTLASLLAMQRRLNSELAAVSGLLHDIYTCRTGFTRFHDENGAEYMRPLLRDSGLFSSEEQRLILEAVFHHSDKQSVHAPLAEVLKDADVLQHYLASPEVPVPLKFIRLQHLLEAHGIPFSSLEWEEGPESNPAAPRSSRALLASIAEEVAARQIEGVPEDLDFQAICRYWPDKDIYNVLKGGWCASFVYHCCREAGLHLPIRHPLVSMRFAGVGAWLQWAGLPETGFLYEDRDFIPQRGDIAVFDKLVSDKPHDHIGIVLSCSEGTMLVAEGNVDNQNRSGIVSRSSNEKIAGFIRISHGYEYQPGSHEFTLPHAPSGTGKHSQQRQQRAE